MDDKVLEVICQSLRYILDLSPYDSDFNNEIAHNVGRVDGVKSVAGWCEFETIECYNLFIQICEEMEQ